MSNFESIRFYDGGWFVCEWSLTPTEKDSIGCDGLYIKAIRIKWWGPYYIWLLHQYYAIRQWLA